MRKFWELVTRPILLERRPRRVVEIGSQAGESTALLLRLCREIGAHADIVDPLPPQNLDTIRTLLEAHGTYHAARSLDALKALPLAEVYLIDGDHNWHTVFWELSLVGRRVSEASAKPPLFLLHDVDWPYGRRDLYYDLDSIPEPDRQPAVRAGLTPGEEGAIPGRGLNQHLTHAAREGGPHNGVRTAIEDFVRDHPEYRFCSVPGFNGLGFVVPIADEGETYVRMIDAVCRDNEPLRGILDAVERERMSALAREESFRTELAAARQALATAEQRARKVERELELLQQSRAYRAVEALRSVRRLVRR